MGNSGNVLLTSRIRLKYFYHWLIQFFSIGNCKNCPYCQISSDVVLKCNKNVIRTFPDHLFSLCPEIEAVKDELEIIRRVLLVCHKNKHNLVTYLCSFSFCGVKREEIYYWPKKLIWLKTSAVMTFTNSSTVRALL